MTIETIETMEGLVSAALQLGAEEVDGWSREEKECANQTPTLPVAVGSLKELIRAGRDPLGEAFCRIRGTEERRPLGQTYTPAPIIQSMIDWAADAGTPTRVIDPGTGSGRYLLAAGSRFPDALLIGADVDPLATLIARGNLAAAGLSSRSRITLMDYRQLKLERMCGKTLFIGNPPYVRHHQIEPEWKRWLIETARKCGLSASGLAGLHVHFFLATAAYGVPGDYGAFITNAEWLDVNYGRLVRDLLLDGLGGQGVHILEPTADPFTDATTTGAITCFEFGSRSSSLRLRRVARVQSLGALKGGRKLARSRLAEASRWGPLTRASPKLAEGYVELGELCRVHRGAVTGANNVWITRRGQTDLPETVLFPSITKARELFDARGEIADLSVLRVVVDLPVDLNVLDLADRKAVDRFLRRAKQAGVPDGYIARTRRAWWSVGLRAAAPILATYMARRPPAFVRNPADARHINIAHGIYPRQPMTDRALERLAEHLRLSVTVGQGRTYAGGLTKFEPKEMERLPVPASVL